MTDQNLFSPFPSPPAVSFWSKQNLMRSSPLNIRQLDQGNRAHGEQLSGPAAVGIPWWTDWCGMLHPLIYCDAIFRLRETAFQQWESCMVPMLVIIHGMSDWETPVFG